MLNLVWLIPVLPLLGFLINFLLGRKFKLSERTVSLVACGTVLVSLLLTLGAFFQYAASYAPAHDNQPFISNADPETGQPAGFPHSFTWMPGGLAHTSLGQTAGALADFNIEWSYQIDHLSLVMMFVVTFVGFWIHVFATGYMHGDKGYYRFFAYLNLFMFMMLLLVMGSNFLIMFIGWEGVGLCSYLLIGYYFDRQEAGDAAKKAFVVNRIGDFGFALAIMGVFATFGTLQFSDVARLSSVYGQEQLWQFGLMSWLALGLFIGAAGKSAQIPLYIWLPDAMAGPTPVSALIHAATMVTAGVFMVTRTNFIFQRSVTMMMVVALIGCLTAFVAATIAVTQTDIKKVLAYSTVSQLGYMFMGAGAGAFIGAIFHVFTHAFFKALLFLGAGAVIHSMHHEQDMTRMGGLNKYLPATYKTMLMGWLAICGIIPFAGFWSKDEILWKTFSTEIFGGGKVLWLIGFVTAGLTAFYMTRMMALTFWGQERFKKGNDHPASHADHSHDPHHHGAEPREAPRNMTVPLMVLAFFSVVGGLVGIPHALSFGADLNFFERWLEPVIVNVHSPEPGHAAGIPGSPATPTAVEHAAGEHAPVDPMEYLLIVLSIAIAVGGILFARMVYVKRRELAEQWAEKLRPLYKLSANKWYLDYLLDVKGVELAKAVNNSLWQVDGSVVDGGVNGTGWLTRVGARVTGFWDKWVIDLAVNATAKVTYWSSFVFRAVQTGFWQNYVLVFAIGLFVILLLYIYTAIPTTLRAFMGR